MPRPRLPMWVPPLRLPEVVPELAAVARVDRPGVVGRRDVEGAVHLSTAPLMRGAAATGNRRSPSPPTMTGAPPPPPPAAPAACPARAGSRPRVTSLQASVRFFTGREERRDVVHVLVGVDRQQRAVGLERIVHGDARAGAGPREAADGPVGQRERDTKKSSILAASRPSTFRRQYDGGGHGARIRCGRRGASSRRATASTPADVHCLTPRSSAAPSASVSGSRSPDRRRRTDTCRTSRRSTTRPAAASPTRILSGSGAAPPGGGIPLPG